MITLLYELGSGLLNTLSLQALLHNQYYFQTAKKIIFGLNSITNIAIEAKRLHGYRVFVISDKNIKKLGIVDKITNYLGTKEFSIKIFDKIESDPSLSTAETATNIARQKTYDLIVGIGGGSVMDIAKIVAIMVNNSGDVNDYVTKKEFKEKALPKILIPTTAGTGSEASQAAVITLDNKQKYSFSNPLLFSDVSIIDPMLTISMPPEITASTGIDALSHAVEAIMSNSSNPVTSALSLEAIRLINDNLRTAYVKGENLKARIGMSWAALLGGMVLCAKVVYGHSIGYTISQRYELSHGASCGLALPYVMEYNLRTCVEKFISIANIFGDKVESVSKIEDARKAIFAIIKLIKDVGLPSSLREAGIPKEDLPILAEELLEAYPRPNNPRPIDMKNALKIYNRAWKGKIDKQL